MADMVQSCVPYQASSVAGEFQRRRWLKADAQHLLSKFGDHLFDSQGVPWHFCFDVSLQVHCYTLLFIVRYRANTWIVDQQTSSLTIFVWNVVESASVCIVQARSVIHSYTYTHGFEAIISWSVMCSWGDSIWAIWAIWDGDGCPAPR